MNHIFLLKIGQNRQICIHSNFLIDSDLPDSSKVRGNYDVKNSPFKNNDEMSLGEEQNSEPYCESPEYPTASINTLVTGHILRQLINHINEVAI